MKIAAIVAACLLMTACNLKFAGSTDLVNLDSTQSNNMSGNFTVPGTWDLKYSWDCSKQASQGATDIDRFSMSIYNSDDDSTAFEHPDTTRKGRSGGETLHFKHSGQYYFTIDSPCDWQAKVVDTSQQ
jgi:hypothetical protein